MRPDDDSYATYEGIPAIVLVEDGRVVDRFVSLMNAGVRVEGCLE